MKVALLGTAPSSCRKAPFADPSWFIWGCSPGLYPVCPRADAWFEVHRWEPPVIGKPDQQVPWFTPEYVLWLARLKCPVWVGGSVPDLPNAKPLPWQELTDKYGDFFFTSSLSWMAAMAMEAIFVNRELLAAKDPRAIEGEDAIGFWGVDMSATEEYGYQRAGCQFFATLAASKGIRIVTPPESDLMMPPPLYGICEWSNRHIKLTCRKNELLSRKAALEEQKRVVEVSLSHTVGQIDDMNYHLGTWIHEGERKGTKFEEMFVSPPVVAPAPAETESADWGPAEPPAP